MKPNCRRCNPLKLLSRSLFRVLLSLFHVKSKLLKRYSVSVFLLALGRPLEAISLFRLSTHAGARIVSPVMKEPEMVHSQLERQECRAPLGRENAGNVQSASSTAYRGRSTSAARVLSSHPHQQSPLLFPSTHFPFKRPPRRLLVGVLTVLLQRTIEDASSKSSHSTYELKSRNSFFREKGSCKRFPPNTKICHNHGSPDESLAAHGPSHYLFGRNAAGRLQKRRRLFGAERQKP